MEAAVGSQAFQNAMNTVHRSVAEKPIEHNGKPDDGVRKRPI